MFFERSDGRLLTRISTMRRIMPYIMKTRNESVVYHEHIVDVRAAQAWLDAYNETTTGPKATMFHLLLWAGSYTLHERPELNRFVSGGRIYQRTDVELSYAAKKAFDLKAPLVTIKLKFPEKAEPFAQLVRRVIDANEAGRSGPPSAAEKESRIALRLLPGFLLKMALGFLDWLDRMNLLPQAMRDSDPLYASAFVANLGSVGIDNTFHHLYDHGTCSMFSVIGTQKKRVFVDDEGNIETRDSVQVCYSFDERIADGFYCASAMNLIHEIIEDPGRYVGDPHETAGAKAAQESRAG